MNLPPFVVSTIAAAILLITLAGCAPAPEQVSPDPVAEIWAETAAPTPEPMALDPADDWGNADGFTTEHEKQVFARFGPRYFVLDDGTAVTVDPGQPLPQPVSDVVRARLEAAGIATFRNSPQGNVSQPVRDTLIAELDAQAALTGRTLLAVFPGFSQGEGWVWLGLPSGADGYGLWTGITDPEDAKARAEAWAANRNAQVLVFER
jgi:hypothetical protein